MPDIQNVTIEDATILWPNFEGREGPYNAKGVRGFTLKLDEDTAKALIADGWNVTQQIPDEHPEDAFWKLAVGVRFHPFPPKVYLLTSAGKTQLTEDTVEMIDSMDIANVDLVIRPYNWSMPSGATGVKAYLKTMFITLNEDDLERKYAAMEAQSDD